MSDDKPRAHDKGERCRFVRTSATPSYLNARCSVCHATKSIVLPPDRRADEALAALNRPPAEKVAETSER